MAEIRERLADLLSDLEKSAIVINSQPLEENPRPPIDKPKTAARVSLWICSILLIGASTFFVLSKLSDPPKIPKLPNIEKDDNQIRNIMMSSYFRADEDGVSWYKITEDADAESLGELVRKLHAKRINMTNFVEPKIVIALAGTSVEELDLSASSVTDELIERIMPLKKLRGLWLNGDAQITDRSLHALAKVPRLKELGLRRTRITDNGLKFLTEEKLPLEILDISNCPDITAEGLNALASMSKLHTLQITGCPKLSQRDIEKFKGLSGIHVIQEDVLLHPRRIGWLSGFPEPIERKTSNWTSLYLRDMADPEFRKFWQNPKNYDLTKAEIAKLNPKYKKYFEDEVFVESIKNPVNRKKLQSEEHWKRLSEMQVSTTKDLLSAIDTAESEDVRTTEDNKIMVADMRDPEFQKFWMKKENWNLSAAQVAKLSPRLRKYFDEPKFASYRLQPAIRRKWESARDWKIFNRMADTLGSHADTVEDAEAGAIMNSMLESPLRRRNR